MTEKIQKILANAGFASRREIERWIVAKRIQVNGTVATLGERVDKNAQILLDEKPITICQPAVTQWKVLLYHKPKGEICSRSDPEGRSTVFDALPKLAAGRWISIGRLDYNTSGLLLFTNNGAWANQLMHPRFHLERVYSVLVFGNVTPILLSRLKKGVELEDGIAFFNFINPLPGNQNYEEKRAHKRWYEIGISIGRNRIVRRLWESQGIKVNRLVRLKFGNIVLPRTLSPSKYTFLSPQEIRFLLEKN